MTIVVPDASVILKWALQRPDEADSALALALLEAFVREKIEIRIPTSRLLPGGSPVHARPQACILL